jgi:hypothetical protein
VQATYAGPTRRQGWRLEQGARPCGTVGQTDRLSEGRGIRDRAVGPCFTEWKVLCMPFGRDYSTGEKGSVSTVRITPGVIAPRAGPMMPTCRVCGSTMIVVSRTNSRGYCAECKRLQLARYRWKRYLNEYWLTHPLSGTTALAVSGSGRAVSFRGTTSPTADHAPHPRNRSAPV